MSDAVCGIVSYDYQARCCRDIDQPTQNTSFLPTRPSMQRYIRQEIARDLHKSSNDRNANSEEDGRERNFLQKRLETRIRLS